MARPIDADAVKFSISGLRYIDPNDYFALAEYFMKQVKAMPTLAPQNEWVSVEERLPGVSGNYICAVKDKNGSVWTIPAEWSLEMKMWIGAFGEIKNIVTYWMPLPKSPKEDE